MFSKYLLRSCVVMLCMSLVSFIIVGCGINPIKSRNPSLAIPTPTFYSATDMDHRDKVEYLPSDVIIQVEHSVTFINVDEYNCLVKNIYFEARNQPIKGKEAIAAVTLERVKSKKFPKTICDVVREERIPGKCQFSWYCDGKSDTPELDNKMSVTAWARAESVAKRALLGKLDNKLRGVLYFHADYVHPHWAQAFTKVIQIGDHIFYKEA